MNETKGYKNIGLADLNGKAKIKYVASRVALLVPRLLGKMATKLIVKPITKLMTGQKYEDIRNDAIDITMAIQQEKADKLDAKIEEGYENLEQWQADPEYLIGNLGKYKSYQQTIEDLEKKQTNLVSAPKRLLVAKHYLYVMGKHIEERRKEKRQEKQRKKAIREYEAKIEAIKAQQEEMQALMMALRESEQRYNEMKKELEGLGINNVAAPTEPVMDADYVETNEEEPVATTPVEEVVVNEVPAFRAPEADELTEQELDNVVAGVAVLPAEVPVEEPVEASPEEQALYDQMANLAMMGQVPASDSQVLESFGLSQEGGQKKL